MSEAVADVFEFEGDEVTDFTAQIPSTKLEAPGAWARGTLLNMNVTFRVRSVRIEEDRNGKLIRHHMLAIEDSTLTGVLTPTERRAAMAAAEAQLALENGETEKVIDEEPGIEDQDSTQIEPQEDGAPDGAQLVVDEVEQLPEGEFVDGGSEVQESEGTGVQMEGVEHPADGTEATISNEADGDWSDVDAAEAAKRATLSETEVAEVVDEAQYADAESF